MSMKLMSLYIHINKKSYYLVKSFNKFLGREDLIEYNKIQIMLQVYTSNIYSIEGMFKLM